jgi:pimeloyl-ACP methyl ester carboxylesterase
MQADEIKATGRMVTRALADGVTHVQQVHQSFANRAFALTGRASVPVRILHNGISTGIYSTVRVAGLATGLAASEVAGLLAPAGQPAGASSRGNLALAVLNSARGDSLARQSHPLAITMAVRSDRADVAPHREALESAFPQATAKLAIFLHGLAETEESWRIHADRQDPSGSTYGSRLAGDFGYTPIYLRYNSGLHISENGRLLSPLLEQVVANWPVPADHLILVGHSMGGLVARSACHYARQDGDSWPTKVRHVFYLGTPHLGAGLEQGVSRLTGALGKIDEARPLATFLDRRSAGIKDLRAGHLLDDHWQPDSASPSGSRDRPSEVPLLASAGHYAVSATVTTHRRNPMGRLLGDLLVQPASARGKARNGGGVPFPIENKRHFGGLHHFNLLNHPLVYGALHDWLDV